MVEISTRANRKKISNWPIIAHREHPGITEKTAKGDELLTFLATTSEQRLLKNVVGMLEGNEEIDASLAEMLLSRFTYDSSDSREDVQWPVGVTKTIPRVVKKTHAYILPPGESSLFPNGLHQGYGDSSDALAAVISEVLLRVPADDHTQVVEWITKLLPNQNIDTLDKFMRVTMNFIANDNVSPASARPLLEFIRAHQEDYLYNVRDDKFLADERGWPLEEVLYNNAFSQEVLEKVVFCLAQQPLESSKKILGILVNNRSYARVLNAIRTQVDLHEMRPTDRTNLERLGKYMLGVDPDSSVTFHTSLNSVYQRIQFENYKPNLEKTRNELHLITEIIGNKYDDKKKKIVDLGSGTGRISNGLARLGYTNITGLDTSDVNLDKAKEADTTMTVKYEPGSMTDMPTASESVDSLICIGRTLPHAENFFTLETTFMEVERVLKMGGTFIFDLPDITKGEYARNRGKYVDFLEDVGVPVKDPRETSRDLEYTYSFVDSPDGENFYNRYCPTVEIVTRMLRSAGFAVEVIKREAVSSDRNEDENIYFKAVKIRSSAEKYTYTVRDTKVAQAA